MGLSRRRKALITLATLIGTFLAALDSTVVGTAMPTVNAVDRAARNDAGLERLLSDPNALLQPAVRSRIPEAAYSEVAGALAASLSPAFWVLLFFGLSVLAVATLFPRGTAKELVRREDSG